MTTTAATPGPLGVLLLTFGSAVTSADVAGYLRSVRGGREPSDELVAEFPIPSREGTLVRQHG